jgi:hypothetical protein
VFRNEHWIGLESRNAQIPFLNEFAEADSGIRLGSAELADIFELLIKNAPDTGNYETQRPMLNFAGPKFRKTLTHG